MPKEKKPKWYVVWYGHAPGVYASWDKAKAQVDGFPGAKYKAFDTFGEADRALNAGPPSPAPRVMRPTDPLTGLRMSATQPIVPSICVDAACDMTTGVMEYRGVDTATRVEIFRMGPFQGATNNLGEFLAVVHALGLQRRAATALPIYTDSRTAMSWLKNKLAKTTVVPNRTNSEVFALIDRAEKWLKQHSYPNKVLKWETDQWGENPADFGRK